MASLAPSRAGSFPIEVKTAAATHAAVMRAGAGEGRLGRPGERALFAGKDSTGGDDLVDCGRTGGKFIIRCIFILHHRIRKRGRDDGIAPLLTNFEIAAIRAGGQGQTATMMRSVGR